MFWSPNRSTGRIQRTASIVLFPVNTLEGDNPRHCEGRRSPSHVPLAPGAANNQEDGPSGGAPSMNCSPTIYLGEIRHRKLRHPGQHPAIVDRAVWEQVQERLRKQAVHHRTLNAKGVSSPLAGKLFDENDEPLYACAANKGERHYRYYVSRKAIRGSTERRASGWRLPALQIERAVASASRQMLGDRPAIATVLQEAGVPIGDLQPALDAADTTSKQLADSSELADNLRNLIDRVQLERGGIRVSLNLRTLLVGEIDCRGAASLTMTRSV